tara:strand:- start:8147 stop:9304 length:1158 start_codon:yes stop_codon:yes gene_type:complete
MINFLSKIKILSFITFFTLSLYSYFGPEKNLSSDSAFDTIQIFGFLIFITSTLVNDFFKNKLIYKIDLLFLLFFISIIISSIISLNLVSIAYSLAFFLNFILITSLFQESQKDIRKSLSLLTIILSIFLLIQFFLYGVDFGFGRNVGNFKPNQYAIIGLSIISFAMFVSLNKAFRILFIFLGFFFATLVLSRGSIFSIIIFLFLYQFNKFYFTSSSLRFQNFSLLALFSIPFIYLFINQFQYIFNNIGILLELTNSTRGIDSGFTGRTVLWAHALDYAKESPLLGSGLRNLEVRTHSGYLLLLLETGIVGIFLFLSAILRTLFLSLKALYFSYDDKVNIAIAYIISMLAYSFIERSLLLFSSPNSLTAFFFIAFLHYYNSKKIIL